MSRNGNAISLEAQKKCLDTVDEVGSILKDHRTGKANMCNTMASVAVVDKSIKAMTNLVRARHDDRMRVTARVRLACCPL